MRTCHKKPDAVRSCGVPMIREDPMSDRILGFRNAPMMNAVAAYIAAGNSGPTGTMPVGFSALIE